MVKNTVTLEQGVQQSRTRSAEKSSRKAAEPLVFSSSEIDELAQVFQNRAGDAKRTANLGLTVTIVIGFMILMLFVSAGFLSGGAITTFDVGPQERNLVSVLAYSVGGLVIRIGAVLIGIFVMQVLINFVRYNTRMYFHWSMCSALVRLSRGNHTVIKEIASTLMPSSIDFGKMPGSPAEKVFDGVQSSIKELIKKIPNRT